MPYILIRPLCKSIQDSSTTHSGEECTTATPISNDLLTLDILSQEVTLLLNYEHTPSLHQKLLSLLRIDLDCKTPGQQNVITITNRVRIDYKCMADTEYIEYMLAGRQIGRRTYRLASRAAGQGPRGYWHAGNDGTQRLLVQDGPIWS